MRICRDQRIGTGCRAENPDGARHCHQCGRSLDFALHLHDAGVQINDYKIVKVIGYGGFGAVYEAERRYRQPQQVALKEHLLPDNTAQLQQEFDVLRKLKHDNLPDYYDFFEIQGKAYLVMELIPGQDLQTILVQQRGTLPEVQVRGYALHLCNALCFLHHQNPPILHRDIKPANIRFTPEGLLKLVDFGLFHQGPQPTRAGWTDGYAPLEQYRAQRTDARSDIYSLGATLYHLLTRQPPPAAPERVEKNVDPLVTPRYYNPQLSEGVAKALLKALSIRPEDRFADVESFYQALFGAVDSQSSQQCPQCGASVLASGKFCSQCGYQFTRVTPNTGTTVVSHPPPTIRLQPTPTVPLGVAPTVQVVVPQREPIIPVNLCCPTCNAVVGPDEIYCQNGHQIKLGTKKCLNPKKNWRGKRCEYDNPLAAKFCEKCGYPL